MAKDISTFPVAEWDIGVVRSHDAMFLRFGYFSHEAQSTEEPHHGRFYLLKKQQALELRDAIDRTLQNLERGESPDSFPS